MPKAARGCEHRTRIRVAPRAMGDLEFTHVSGLVRGLSRVALDFEFCPDCGRFRWENVQGRWMAWRRR